MAKYLIFRVANPSEVVIAWDSEYNFALSTNEEEAVIFNTETEAQYIIDQTANPEFWGTRPPRKP